MRQIVRILIFGFILSVLFAGCEEDMLSEEINKPQTKINNEGPQAIDKDKIRRPGDNK